MEYNRTQLIGLVLGPLVFTLTLVFFEAEGLNSSAKAVLASTLWVAIWWITEAIPISVTALLPIILFPLTKGLAVDATTAAYGHRYIFLYIGGFILAITIEKWELHRRIALNIIRLIGTDISRIILGFMAATAFLSMWISNTATSVMMFPIGMSIISQLKDNPNTVEDENKIFGKALMLSIAYGASIGGMATLIGTPPNLVLAGVVQESFGIDISFAKWFKFGLPISMILLIIGWQYLAKYAFTFKQQEFPGGKAEILRLIASLGKMGKEEKTVLVVFIVTAILWISRQFLQNFIPALDDSIIAIAAGLFLFVLPAKGGNTRLIKWEDAVKMPWGIILLFGGGMALADGFKTTGLAEWIGSQLTLLQGASLLILILILITTVNFLTEITSNLATTAMLLPIMVPMALSIDVHPYILMVAATVAASCAFMLPVATPPNAVVFGSGYLRISDMVKAGIWMNIISVIIVTIFVLFFLPVIWDFDATTYPIGFGK